MSRENLANAFYNSYLKDNVALLDMPKECWDFVQEHKVELYEAWKDSATENNGWEQAEKEVRMLLRKNGLDGDSW